jgi:hypothetical protein
MPSFSKVRVALGISMANSLTVLVALRFMAQTP